MKDDNLPASYRPFARLNLCSNSLEGVLIPFKLSGFVPLLIGIGPSPLVWINRPIIKTPGTRPEEWAPLVEENRALHPEIVIRHPETGGTQVIAKGHMLLDCATDAQGNGTVRQLDLRPIGLMIHGAADGLTFATHRIANNSFKNVRVMLGMNNDDRK